MTSSKFGKKTLAYYFFRILWVPLPQMVLTIQGGQTTFLGMRELPRALSDFEIKALFTFDSAECEAGLCQSDTFSQI